MSLENLETKLGLDAVRMADFLQGLLPVNEILAENLATHLGGTKQFWLNRERLYRNDLARLAASMDKDGL